MKRIITFSLVLCASLLFGKDIQIDIDAKEAGVGGHRVTLLL